MLLALARKIVNGDEDEAETVEAVFAQARDAESAAEEYLVDDGWQAVETEPETVAVDVTASGIAPVLDNGHDESPESAQTLFSWAEFITEGPVRPKSRSRKPHPASLSMFEWALGMEREREVESVGAGR